MTRPTDEKSKFDKGDRVRVDGERGTYKVYCEYLYPDGSVLLFGGDMDPNGVQYFRSVLATKLKPDPRKRKG